MYYEEDRFLPTTFDDDSRNFDMQKAMLQNLKSVDKGYHVVKRHINAVWTDGKYYKTKTIEMYTSGDIGTRIRNAITGTRYTHKVGTAEEDLYFKVKNVSEKLGDSVGSLFYDSPEQFENHQMILLDSETKENWYNKHIEARRYLKLKKSNKQ